MFLEIFFSLVFGWVIFSYYSDSNLDDILVWLRKIINSILHHDIISKNQMEILDNDDMNESFNEQIVEENIKNNVVNNNELEKSNNQYDELLDLAMNSENNDEFKFENNDKERIMPIQDREIENDNIVPINNKNKFDENIKQDFKKENNNSFNEPSFDYAHSSLEGSSLL